MVIFHGATVPSQEYVESCIKLHKKLRVCQIATEKGIMVLSQFYSYMVSGISSTERVKAAQSHMAHPRPTLPITSHSIVC